LMVFWLTPRTDDDPPGPGSQILPTPGHWPLVARANVRLADVAAAADVDESATLPPASIVAATASVNAIRRMSTSPPCGTFTTSPNAPRAFAIGTFNQGLTRNVRRPVVARLAESHPTATAFGR
jgi:hypothetical protein